MKFCSKYRRYNIKWYSLLPNKNTVLKFIVFHLVSHDKLYSKFQMI